MDTSQHNSVMHTSTQQLSNKAKDMIVKHTKYYSNEASSRQCTFFKDNTTIGKGVNNVCTNSFLPSKKKRLY